MNETCGQEMIPRKQRGLCAPITGAPIEEVNSKSAGKRKCGCTRTSEKLKQILGQFPTPPPPTPMDVIMYDKACGYGYGHGETAKTCMHAAVPRSSAGNYCTGPEKNDQGKSWKIVSDMVTVVQMSVTATALALYYLIYCYMQIVYYTLKSAMYFHNADGPMKITIGVVTATSLIIAFNIMMRMEKIIGMVY